MLLFLFTIMIFCIKSFEYYYQRWYVIIIFILTPNNISHIKIVGMLLFILFFTNQILFLMNQIIHFEYYNIIKECMLLLFLF